MQKYIRDKPEDFKTNIARGAGLSFAGKVIGGGLQYLYTIVVARILGLEIFGQFMLGFTIINLAAGIGRLGLEGGVVRFVSLYKGTGDKGRIKGAIMQSLKYSIVPSTVIGIFLFLTADPVFIRLFKEPDLENTLKILSLSLPFLALMTITLAATQGFQIMKYTVYCQNIFMPAFNLLLVLLFFFAGFKLSGAAAAFVISVFITSILSVYYLLKSFPEMNSIASIPDTKEIVSFSVTVLLSTLFINLIVWTDTLMLGYLRSSEEVGVYNAVARTALLMGNILASFIPVFAPIISDLFNRSEIQKLETLFKIVTKWIFKLSFPLFLFIVLFSKEILAMFGADFVQGWSSLAILSFAQIINASAGPVAFILMMSGKPKMLMYNSLLVCMINIVLNYVLIPRYGIIGAAIASCSSIIILNLLMLFETYRFLKIHPYNRKFLKPFTLGITTYVVVIAAKYWFHDLSSMYQLIIFIPLFLVCFAVLLYKWGIDDEDRFIIEGFKKKFARL